MTPTLILALVAAQQSPSAEEAITAQRSELRRAMRVDCPPSAEGEDIVVCARGGIRQEYRIPYVPEPGRISRLPGEAPSGVDALGAPSCCGHGGGINVLGVAKALTQGLDRILHPD
jgi:hypothetical protein